MTDRFALPGGRATVATLVATHGTSPKAPGAKMWVGEDGRVLGSVTIGGCVDARVIEESGRILASGEPALVEMALGDEDAWALGMTCGGTVELLLEPVDPSRGDSPVVSALRLAEAAVAAGRRAVIVSGLGADTRRIVVDDLGAVHGTLGDHDVDDAATREARELVMRGSSAARALSVAGVERRLYFEVYAPPVTLVVFGATHVAMPLVELAHPLGIRAVIVDGRERFATRDRFPLADEIHVGIPSEIATSLVLGPSTLVAILAHDYKYDLPVLKAVLATDAAYVGLLGSVRRGRALLQYLADEGVPAEQLSRVRVPVGLDIGAQSAAEIALSVLAEAIAVQRGRPGGAMRDRTKRAESLP
ncbi:MAG: putative xanthine dehydrogenase subunit A [Gemmatimonadaceae bacterium]|nr:putative xanthine dehydrogenase subunit A [Gemmatimonadaceae bacterium]